MPTIIPGNDQSETAKIADILRDTAELQEHTLNEIKLLNERYEDIHETGVKMEETDEHN